MEKARCAKKTESKIERAKERQRERKKGKDSERKRKRERAKEEEAPLFPSGSLQNLLCLKESRQREAAARRGLYLSNAVSYSSAAAGPGWMRGIRRGIPALNRLKPVSTRTSDARHGGGFVAGRAAVCAADTTVGQSLGRSVYEDLQGHFEEIGRAHV